MNHRTIVPSLWYNRENENPSIELSQHGFVVPTECKQWERTGNENRVACVNSFGFGGTNAHCIVEEYIPESKQTYDNESCLPFIITISSYCNEGLIKNVRHMNDALKSQEYDIRAVSYTSTCRRDHRSCRKAVFGNRKEIIAAFDEFLRLDVKRLKPSPASNVVFVFCGVGTAWQGMCRSLMNLEIFRQTIQRIDEYLKKLTGWVISSKLNDRSDILTNPLVTHIAIFACQIGLAALWKHLGINPDVVVGQSVGEVAAAYVAGYLDLQSAVGIIYNRSNCLAKVTTGTMAVVHNVEVSVVENYCRKSGSVCIAVYNSKTSCTVSGLPEDIVNLKQNLQTIGDNEPVIVDLDVKCAYHSTFVDKAANELDNTLDTITSDKERARMFSTVTGKLETYNSLGTSNYWRKNVRMPVQFSHAIEEVVSENKQNIFIELGPSPVLRAHIDKILSEEVNYTSVPSMRKKDEINTFTEALCTLFELGLNPKWSNLFQYRILNTDIPMYQFRKYTALHQSSHRIKKNQGMKIAVDHLYVKHMPMLRGAAYADVGFEIGHSVLDLSKRNIALSLEFMRPVKIQRDVETVLFISTIAQGNKLLFHAKQHNVTMCKGWIKSTNEHMESHEMFDIECIRVSMSDFECKHMAADKMYSHLKTLGFTYGPHLTLIKTCLTNGLETLAEIDIPDDIVSQYDSTTLHPCVLDGMMQSTIITTSEETLAKIRNEKISIMPVAVGKLRICEKPKKEMYIFTKRINETFLETVLQIHYNILLLSKNGEVLADLQNYTIYGKRNESIAPSELNYRLNWHPIQKKFKPQPQKHTHVLMLTSEFSKQVSQEFTEFENIYICQNVNNSPNKTFISDAFKNNKKMHAVVILIKNLDFDTDIDASLASEIHESVRNNCVFLTALVRYMTDENVSLPLYVITQNTQPTFKDGSAISAVGGELWGFIRSIHLEFIYGDITLIDIQPSLKQTKRTLVSFILDTCHNTKDTIPEIIIHNDIIYGAQFTKIPKKKIIPRFRFDNRVLRHGDPPHELLADRSKRIRSLFLKQSMKNEEISKDEYMSVHIKSVCLHPLSIYPRTTSGVLLDQDTWKDDDGHKVIGIEYTCIPTSSYSTHEYHTVEHNFTDSKCELLTVFPSEIQTKMSVPRDCTVSLTDIPFYQPGIIAITILCWNLTRHVPKGSSVLVYSHKNCSLSKLILEKLVCSLRKASLVNLSNYQESTKISIDVLVTIDAVDSSFPVLMRCKKIICLEECISEPLRLKVSRSVDQTIATLSAKDLLERTCVSYYLSLVVSWLQRNKESLGIMERHFPQDECDLPFPSYDIIKNGKVVLPIGSALEQLFSKNAIYIVTGGLTGLGWEVVGLLAEMGAGTIVSISRQDRSSNKRDDINLIEKATGCKIISVKGDVSDLTSISRAIRNIELFVGKKPIRGIFHGAGVLNSKLLMDMEKPDIDFVLRPKVIGTMNMHQVTKGMDLDYFVVSSSINSLIGSPGQSSYGAANSFLDTFMEWRRGQGLPGQAINWGPLCVGMVSSPELVKSFQNHGFNPLSVLEIRSCFQDALMRNATGIIYADVNWDMFSKVYNSPNLKRTRLQMSVLIEQAISDNTQVDHDESKDVSIDIKLLQNLDSRRQNIAIAQVIKKISSKVTGEDLSQISMTTTFVEMSFDSISIISFINIVQNVTGYRIPTAFMLNTNNNLNDVVQLLRNELFEEGIIYSRT
ncbi:phthioceranic/hydroxyphthioceranic acid synthase-like [Ruditapes philippinarum]|uniref:phthioceranic/hydroxyphthioceranic acid synthase-like n=1 Tax=Ruditapes philippinarum TaxID=129788 RepID=UPI00295A7642|nr:phthioceranic/hydroxyphthioceranic acid synthase-like [Ruditapes philippinarum]